MLYTRTSAPFSKKAIVDCAVGNGANHPRTSQSKLASSQLMRGGRLNSSICLGVILINAHLSYSGLFFSFYCMYM